MYKQRLVKVIEEIESIAQAISDGQQDPANLQGTNLDPFVCATASNKLMQASGIIEVFIDNYLED